MTLRFRAFAENGGCTIAGASESPGSSRCRLRHRAYIANVEGQVCVRSAAAWCEGGLLGRATCGEPTAGGVAAAGRPDPAPESVAPLLDGGLLPPRISGEE